ncbi:MAG: Deoxyribose-phosphate aldolase [Anaerolineae bacterium]|nr:Deoxyribose-phosphate aldolase [Anaerolineae bacterium]
MTQSPAAFDASKLSRAELAKYIQSTSIAPDASRDEIIAHLEKCAEYNVDAAMIAMCWVPLARNILRGTDVKVATFFGIGVGTESVNAKIALLKECIWLEADEVDYQPNMSFFLSGMYEEFEEEAARLVKTAEEVSLKVMLELSCLPDDGQKRHAAQLLIDAGVPWLKNSSGWGKLAGPATVEDIRLLSSLCQGTASRVKASGKINSYQRAVDLLNAGAELLGTSSAELILAGSAPSEPEEADY